MGCLLQLLRGILHGCALAIVLVFVLSVMILLLGIGLVLGDGVWWAEHLAWAVFIICFLTLAFIFMLLFVPE